MLLELAAWLIVVGAAIVCGLSYAHGRWNVTLGVLFAAASFSVIIAPTPVGSVRPEQGAIIVLALAMLATRTRDIWALVRAAPFVALSAGLYLGANVASSLLFAPDRAESLKIAAWLALSMVAMVVAAVMVRTRAHDLELPKWIVGAACIQTMVGLAAVTSQALLGTDWGVQTNDALLGKTKGLSWEANILAINLAMALAFVIFPDALRLSTRVRILLLGWLAFGLGLAYSRGGVIALGVAVAAAGLALVWEGRHRLHAVRSRLIPIGALSAMALVIAVSTFQVQLTLGRLGFGVTPDTVIINNEIGPVAIPTPRPRDPTASSQPSASPPVRYVGAGDTIGVRIRNIRTGLADFAESPIVGLGTDSFRQRHQDPACGCPGHIANLPFATLYDSGSLGLLGLAGLLASALWAAWRTGRWAYIVALIVMIVGYQVTDAFRFASNWILLGVVFGLWLGGMKRSELITDHP